MRVYDHCIYRFGPVESTAAAAVNHSRLTRSAGQSEESFRQSSEPESLGMLAGTFLYASVWPSISAHIPYQKPLHDTQLELDTALPLSLSLGSSVVLCSRRSVSTAGSGSVSSAQAAERLLQFGTTR